MGHHEAGTTASEFDGALEEPEPEDEDNVNVDEFDEDLEPKREKSSKKVCSWLHTSLEPIATKTSLQISLSKRDVARLSEVSYFIFVAYSLNILL